MSNYKDYMPKKESTVMVQAKIKGTTHEKIFAILQKEGWTWHDFMNGLFEKYLDDQKTNKKGA